MLGTTIEIQQLPIDKDLLDTSGNTSYLQQVQNISLGEADVEHLLKHTKAIIDKELDFSQREDDSTTGIQFNQIAVNVAFRVYYQLLRKYNRQDKYFQHYGCLGKREAMALNEKECIIQYFVLLTARGGHFEPQAVRNRCMKTFAKAVDSNETFVLTTLKTVNLIFKKWPHLDVCNELSLEHLYFCLQSNQTGMRDEMIVLLKHVCSCRETAFSYFAHIVHFWPWTNRSKLYMIGCILKKHMLSELLEKSGFCGIDFFNGLRLTLNFKNLLAPSQYVIQALSSQSSLDLLHLCMDILTNGSRQELRNFNAHWFSRIEPNEELFQMVQNSTLMDDIKDNKRIHQMPPVKSYRMVLVFSLFSKEILQLYPQGFSAFSATAKNDCFEAEIETQLLIFKLIVDNLANIPVEDAMVFFNVYIQKHMLVENAQFRNTILGKMPVIINHLAKTYCKLCSKNGALSEIETRILIFFQQLQKDVECGICSQMYQPKIFGLKLLDILMKSLYGKSIKKNAKNCSITQNQELGEFLKRHKVFDCIGLGATLMRLLNDPSGFDDALYLIVVLIGVIQPGADIVHDAFQMSTRCCALRDVDEANLSSLYARVAIANCTDNSVVIDFFKETLHDIKTKLNTFEKDPLYACKLKGWHLFSSLNVLNELVQHKPEICINAFADMLLSIEKIETAVLKMMNVCNSQDSSIVNAASFEDMDKSLQMLVCSSEYASLDHERSRKYLLMTFWLTLKACCDLSASIGEILVRPNEMAEVRVLSLKRCLQINVIVLTKCRHKGAIETAGGTIGKLTRCITSQFTMESREYGLLHKCVQKLYDAGGSEVSTTRRGAGFAIMFLHIVKNEVHRGRPILREAMRNLLKPAASTESATSNTNCDRIEALHLHYLCVLVRDTELKEAVSKYNNEIMISAISQIDNPEWTICNAALQLFGALVPKIVGQRQATEFEESLLWEPSEVTFCEITRKLKMPFDYILKYSLSGKCSTRSIILFLEFLHKVEYIHKSSQPECILEYRELIWCLLRHHCEKVRVLAAKCFVRSHEFSMELPHALKNIANILFSVQNENFFEGLIQALYEGILKLQHDSKFVISLQVQQDNLQQISSVLMQKFVLRRQYTLYSLCKLWDMLQLLAGVEDQTLIIEKLKHLPLPRNDSTTIATDLWLKRIQGD